MNPPARQNNFWLALVLVKFCAKRFSNALLAMMLIKSGET
jgi:hypothetical protein